MLLILKLLVAPGLVAAVTLAVRRWGPAVGGWLSGMPVVTGRMPNEGRGSPLAAALLFALIAQVTVSGFTLRASRSTKLSES